mmetsp:Transcript_26412/g.44597  ORF Transcript_26412/g.44597 Transcript_26412/m.44597 type:complete len:207 (+) Transcript_26412:619-1239(+)
MNARYPVQTPSLLLMKCLRVLYWRMVTDANEGDIVYIGSMLAGLAHKILSWMCYGGFSCGSLIRHALESTTSYDAAVNLFALTYMVAPCYFIVVGVQPKDGVVLARDLHPIADWHYCGSSSSIGGMRRNRDNVSWLDLSPTMALVQTNTDHAVVSSSSSSSSNGQSTSAPNVSGSNSSVWWPWRFASGTSTATINMTRGTKAKPSN